LVLVDPDQFVELHHPNLPQHAEEVVDLFEHDVVVVLFALKVVAEELPEVEVVQIVARDANC